MLQSLPYSSIPLTIGSFALADDSPDGFCTLPPAASIPADALPTCTIQPITQGQRLDTLNGKTIALVGGSFMASVTHPELKRLILDEFPSSSVVLLGEIGSAGPYPRPGVIRPEKTSFSVN